MALPVSFFRIHVQFLAGHYHGVEWPPSPLRVMQAIVAGNARTGPIEPDDPTLCWLEQLEHPVIHAPNIRPGMNFTVYVPRNSDDLTLLSHYKNPSFHEVQSKRRTRYDAQPTQRRWVEGPLTYEWRVADPEAAHRLGKLSHELVSLGRAEDLAFARYELSDKALEQGPCTWSAPVIPGRIRNPLYIPARGSLAGLVMREEARRYRNESKEYVDPFVVCEERNYECGSDPLQRPYLLYELHDLREGELLSWRQNEGVTVSAMIRHALGKRVPQPYLGYATGHVEGGDLDDRLSWIPLPSIGHQHADGRIRRAMILAPRGDSYDSVRFSEIRHALAHAALVRHDVPIGTLEEADMVNVEVRPYLETGRRWHTVTPLVTHGRTSRGGEQKGKFSPRKAEKLILQALAKAGLPDVEEMHFQSAPFESSCRGAQDYRVPGHLASFSRFHVSVSFAEPVSGPVLVGTGRHYGLGLFCVSGKSH